MSCSEADCVSFQQVIYPIQQVLVEAIVESLAYGCLFVVSLISIYYLIRRGLPSVIGRKLVLTIACALFISSTISFGARVAYNLANVASGPSKENHQAVMLCHQLYPVIIAFSRFNFVMTDAMVAWRAWVLSEYRFFQSVLIVCMTSTVIGAFVEASISIRVGPPGGPNIGPWVTSTIVFAPMLMTSLLSTFIIHHKTWVYRHDIKAHLPKDSTRRNQVENTLLLLVESGFLYCFFIILSVIALCLKSFPPTGLNVINSITDYTSAIYPLTIILIVEHQKSAADLQVEDTPALSLQFATRPSDHNDRIEGPTFVRRSSWVTSRMTSQRSSHQSVSPIRFLPGRPKDNDSISSDMRRLNDIERATSFTELKFSDDYIPQRKIVYKLQPARPTITV